MRSVLVKEHDLKFHGGSTVARVAPIALLEAWSSEIGWRFLVAVSEEISIAKMREARMQNCLGKVQEIERWSRWPSLCSKEEQP
jgi:hypothetical protein